MAFKMTLIGLSLAIATTGTIASALVQSDAGPQRVSPNSHWWIDRGDCSIQGQFGTPQAQTTIWIIPAGDGYRMEILAPDWRDMDGANFDVSIGFDRGAAETLGPTSGFASDGRQGFTAPLPDALVAQIGSRRSLELYRGSAFLTDWELDGAGAAVAALTACTGALHSDNMTMPEDEAAADLANGLMAATENMSTEMQPEP